jgi:hypothetical protein
VRHGSAIVQEAIPAGRCAEPRRSSGALQKLR